MEIAVQIDESNLDKEPPPSGSDTKDPAIIEKYDAEAGSNFPTTKAIRVRRVVASSYKGWNVKENELKEW